ncbi:MAG: amidase family protein [Pseudomonadota bacterium]
MNDKPIWQWSACDQANAIAKGEVSCVEVVSSSVERMASKNGDLNAVVDDLSESALAEAKAHDWVLQKSGPIGPLHGVPVTIKENIDQAGRATPNGVAALKGVIAPADSPVVTNLKKAGAIVIGRTNTPEFSFRATTTNELHGRTFNPWNDWASSGGSSGGASSAVMSGMGSLAHGNDIGGSLRYPAAATGAATVKPGLGRVPAYNPSATSERGLFAQLTSVQGIIAREVKDVRLGMQSLIAYDPHDPWQVPMPWEGPEMDGPIKVAFTKNSFEFDMHPAVEKALDHARKSLEDAGYGVEEIEPPLVREIADAAGRTLFGEVEAMLGNDIRAVGSDTLKSIFESYYALTPPLEGLDLLKGFAQRSHYIREWQLFQEKYPLVLTPLLPTPTYQWDRDAQGIEGAKEVLQAGFHCIAMNYMGLPAGNIPANYNDGLPVGVQIVGRRWREDLILDACEAIEERTGIMAEQLFGRE